jgi:hypothetical protein
MHWNLPKAIAYPIRYHHQPNRAKECPRESTIVALAEAWTRLPEGADRRHVANVPDGWLSMIGLDANSAGVAFDLVSRLERAHFAWDAEHSIAAAR